MTLTYYGKNLVLLVRKDDQINVRKLLCYQLYILKLLEAWNSYQDIKIGQMPSAKGAGF